MDYMLEPPEPVAVRDETREVSCTNDDCAMFEQFVEEKVEVDYWSDHEARFTWFCDRCQMENEVEFDPYEQIDWDSYYEGVQ
jgi:hypothetical protein